MYDYRATVIRVVDGDTADLRVDLVFDVSINSRYRLSGIDAPERGKPGDTTSLNQQMIEAGHAKPYDGGRR